MKRDVRITILKSEVDQKLAEQYAVIESLSNCLRYLVTRTICTLRLYFRLL